MQPTNHYWALGFFIALLFSSSCYAQEHMSAEQLEKAKRSADAGLRFLRNQQLENGSWLNSVGITALATRAFLENRRGYDESDGAFITRPVAFLLQHVNDNGSISESGQNSGYNTAVALVALQALDNPQYDAIIKAAQTYLKNLQLEQSDGYEPDHKFYGGIGYGGDERPDLSNQYLALEGLRATALDPEDPAWQRALVFISRSQNRSESNDQSWAANDGGFTYMPGYSPHGGTDSYGGMTHAGLIGLLFAGADKQDPRVKAAYDWIRSNYTLANNPGVANNSGLFYYYNAFAKSMYAYGDPILVDVQGDKHNWREDLTRQLLSMQAKDGSWVNPYSGRWWEDKPELVTAWSVIALNHVIRQ